MDLALYLSIVIRLVAIAWAVLLLLRLRDWRIGLLVAMLVLMALRQMLTLLVNAGLALPAGLSSELPGLPVSVMALLAVVFMGRLIADQRQARARLQQSHNRLQRILDSMFAFVGLLTPDGILIEANQAPLDALGLKREEVIGRPLHELYSWSYSPQVQAELCETLRRVAQGETVRGDFVVRVAGDRLITIDTTFSPLTDRTGQVVELVGSAVDITDRKRVEEALQQTNARLQTLSRRLLQAQEAERQHIARELHDEIGQVLTAVSISLHAAKPAAGAVAQARLDEGISIVEHAIQQVRTLSLDLRPSMLDDLGLEAALRWYADRQAQRGGFVVQWVSQLAGTRLPAEIETACFRVTQEALTNVVRHARAQQVRIELRRQEDELQLAIDDDGVGFDLHTARQHTAHGRNFGLLSMQERAELLGSRFEIDSAPQRGTLIRVQFPIPAAEP